MPLNSYLKARQVAYLLAWLTSEENTHTTGQTIYIDGGSDASIRGDNIWRLSLACARKDETGHWESSFNMSKIRP